jgi:hypothetical protein
MEPPIFFSYARQDAEIAMRLAAELKEAGLNVWIDQVDLVAGRHWDLQIQEALNSSHTIIVLLTPASVTSPNVLDEISFTINEGKRLVPVMAVKCTIPIRIIRLHYIDLTTNYKQGLQLLVRDLGGSRQPVVPETPPNGGPAAQTFQPMSLYHLSNQLNQFSKLNRRQRYRQKRSRPSPAPFSWSAGWFCWQ